MREKEKKILIKAGIDVEAAMKRFEDDEDAYIYFIRKFSNDTNYQKLCNAVKDKDRETAMEAAHSMKGLTANLSINSMYQILVPLVEELRTEIVPEDDVYLLKLKPVYHDVIKAIEYIN